MKKKRLRPGRYEVKTDKDKYLIKGRHGNWRVLKTDSLGKTKILSYKWKKPPFGGESEKTLKEAYVTGRRTIEECICDIDFYEKSERVIR
jgi:hypothetical protein